MIFRIQIRTIKDYKLLPIDPRLDFFRLKVFKGYHPTKMNCKVEWYGSL